MRRGAETQLTPVFALRLGRLSWLRGDGFASPDRRPYQSSYAPGSASGPLLELKSLLLSNCFTTSLSKESNLMAHRFLISHDSPLLYITLLTHHRLPVFRTYKLRELACTAIDEARKTAGFLLVGYVIMIDHLHVVLLIT